MSARFAIAIDGPVADIIFDDGGVNLLSSAALKELSSALGESGDAVRAVVFRSGHESIFAAGADMDEMSRFDAAQAREFSRLGQELFDSIERSGRVFVAAIDGDCFGGALDLALSFDVRICTPRSRFSHPGSRIGIVTGFGGTSRWRKLLEPAAARRLFLDNPVLSADDARASGLVDEVVKDDLVSRAHAIARAAAERPAEEVKFVKELLSHAQGHSASQLALISSRLAGIYFPEFKSFE